MKITLILIGMFFFSSLAFATVPPPGFSCSYDKLMQTANEAVNDFAKNHAIPFKNAVAFVTGGAFDDGIPDPKTGLTSRIYIPFTMIDAAGKIIGQGEVTLNGSCKSTGGGSWTNDVHTYKFH